MSPDELIRLVLGHLSLPILLINREHRIVFVNNSSDSRPSLSEACVGRTCFEVNHWCSQPCWQIYDISCPIQTAFQTGKRAHAIHKHLVEDKLVVEETIATPLRDNQYVVQELRDISKLLGLLEGLLTICASCKSIRDEEGRWYQVEGYLHNHTGADCTHTICPRCRGKLYPDLFPGK